MNNQVIIDPVDLLRGYTFRDGFVFKCLTEPANVYDAIVIRNPESCNCWTPKIGISNRSLEEHIEYINRNHIEKAVIIAENITFITRCPSLKYLQIMPADTAPNEFHYSPLYEMPDVTYLVSATAYGRQEQLQTSIDYSKVKGLTDVSVSATKGDLNLDHVLALKRMRISNFQGKSLESILGSEILEGLEVIQSALRSLSGIACSRRLDSVCLWYNRSLSDISALEMVRGTLKVLSIENCPKITDFSCLSKLNELEHLELRGSNALQNLSFLQSMKKLKSFSFTMDVLDGDLSPCMHLIYADCARNRKHFNLKDKDLPKGKFDVNVKGL